MEDTPKRILSLRKKYHKAGGASLTKDK